VPDRPNILFVMCDQLVAALTGAYDHPVVQTPHLNGPRAASTRPTTPHLNRLAEEGEWRNLAADPAHKETATRLRQLVLDRFDPNQIAADNLDSLYRRRLIRETMRHHNLSWAHDPVYDPRRGTLAQYLP